MRLYKICSNELYQVSGETGHNLEVEYCLDYDGKNEINKETICLYSGLNLTVVTEKGEESKFTDPLAAERLDDITLAALEALPLHVKQPIKRALGKK